MFKCMIKLVFAVGLGDYKKMLCECFKFINECCILACVNKMLAATIEEPSDEEIDDFNIE
jgi:hypothetical protein